MYKISVPVMNSNVERADREKTLELLKDLDAERVFLALDVYELDESKRTAALETLERNCRYFKEQGFEVGAWIWTFMFGGKHPFRSMRSIAGTDIGTYACPTDSEFRSFSIRYIKDIVRTGVDLVMFDDDFRYGFLSNQPACLCDGHIERINRITGEQSTLEELKEHILTGGKNKYRDAWLKVNGEVFEEFAADVRRAVDEVDKRVRVGACTCMTSWDIDGTDARRLARILAGNTKPFVRLIGAPYWAVNASWGNRLQDVVELERMESSWTKDSDIEIMAEGDAYPRPRSCCPASYLELFDTAIRASGCTDGILKYGIDYCSNADYETGYVERHIRNRELYKAIDKAFRTKSSCGVRIYESAKKVADMVCPTAVNKSVDIQYMIFSAASRMLAWNAVPSVYEGQGVTGIAFDENARHLPDNAFDKGLIIDITAAEILLEKGIDVGIEALGEPVSATEEHFLGSDNHIATGNVPVQELTLKPGAEILSDTETEKGTVPMSYRYENADGQRFLVLNINTRRNLNANLRTPDPLKHYARGKQIAEAVEWLSGEKLPASCNGHPALYMQCKEGDGALSVGLWNMYADFVTEPKIKLSKPYREISFIGCSGRLDGDTVSLTDIPAFGFAGFEVK